MVFRVEEGEQGERSMIILCEIMLEDVENPISVPYINYYTRFLKDCIQATLNIWNKKGL